MRKISMFLFALMLSFTVSAQDKKTKAKAKAKKTKTKLTLRERKEFKRWEEDLVKVTAAVKKSCGSAVKIELDKKFVTPFMEASATGAGYCESAIDGLRSVCGTDQMSKDAVKESVKKIKCVYNSKKKEITYKLSKGTFEIKIGLDTPNLSSQTKKYLENNL